MKKLIFGLMAGLLLVGVNALAGDGDLIVNGNAGIGTTTPSTKLHVSNATYPQLTVDDNTSRTFALGVTTSTFRLRDVTGAADRLTVDVSGNVGIGTTSPGAKLTIQQPSDDSNGGVRIIGTPPGLNYDDLYVDTNCPSLEIVDTPKG